MRPKALEALATMPLNAGVERSADTRIARKISLWYPGLVEKTLEHANLVPNAPTVVDRTLAFTRASINKYDIIEQSWWESLRGLPPENTVSGPANLNVRAVANQRREGFVVWLQEVGIPIESAIANAWPKQNTSVQRLGEQVAVVENLTPIRRTPITIDDYIQEGGVNRALTPEETKKQYHEGLERIFAAVEKGFFKSETSAQWTSALDQLHRLRDFYRVSVGWGEEKQGAILSMQSLSQMAKAWCVVLSPEHPRCSKEGETLSLDREDGLLRLLIKPWQIDEHWAGQFLAYDLTYMERMVSGTYVKGDKDDFAREELLAYQTEYITALAASGGRLEQWLDAAIDCYGLTSFQEIDAKVPLLTLSQDLDGFAGLSAPHNIGEVDLRAGFYRIALGLRLNERVAKSPEEIDHLNHAYIKDINNRQHPKS